MRYSHCLKLKGKLKGNKMEETKYEYMILRPLINGSEIEIPLQLLNDTQRNKIKNTMLKKKSVTVSVLGIKIQCYISYLYIKKVT
jgi:hypothetical protein